jgi:hypothetical protein
VGFLVSLGVVILPPIGSFVALVSFMHWQSALAFVGGMVVIALAAIRFHEKHNRSDAFDDRLTDDRMRQATDELVTIWKKE